MNKKSYFFYRMLAFFLKKRFFSAILKLLPATIPATLSDAALLFGIRSFVKLISGDSFFSVPEWLLCMVLLAFLRFYFLRLRGSIAENSFRRLGANLQIRFFATLRSLHPRFFHDIDYDSKLRASFEATETLPRSGESLVQALQAIVQLAVFFPVLVILSWQLTLLLFCVVLPMVLFSQKKLQQMGGAEEAVLACEGTLRSELERARDMKRFWSDVPEQNAQFKSVFLRVRMLLDVGVRLAIRKLTLSLLIEVVSVIAMVVVLAICAYMITCGWMTTEDLVLYSSAVFLCYKPVKECSRAMPQLRSAVTAYNVLNEFSMQTSSRKSGKEKANSAKYVDQPIVHVSSGCFSYGDTSVFKNFDLDISLENGKPIFLLGANGAGKSTLLRLIAGLEYFDSGCLEISKKFKSVFFLSQGVFLPPVEILRNNLRSSEEIDKFIEIAKVAPLLEKSRHSGGESARIGLLWALVSDAKLVLLDEPFAFISRFDKDEILAGFLDACALLGKSVILSGHEELPRNLAERFIFVTLDKGT